MCESEETIYDYHNRLNFEGKRTTYVYNRRKLDYVLRKVRKYLKPSSAACDIGIGEGYVLTRLYDKGLKVTGIEISKYSVEYLENDYKKKGLKIKLINGDITNIELDENQFDVVTCFDVLEHITKTNKVQRLKR